MTLLLRTILILFQDTVDNTDERIELRADRRPRPDITRWRRIAQHLPDRARVDPKTTSRFALAQTLNHWELYRRVDFPTLATYLYGREREQPWHTKHPAKRTAKGSA